MAASSTLDLTFQNGRGTEKGLPVPRTHTVGQALEELYQVYKWKWAAASYKSPTSALLTEKVLDSQESVHRWGR